MGSFKIKLLLITAIGLLLGSGPNVFAESANDYRIGPADVLHISVWQESDLECTAKVLPEGVINYPLIGRIKVAGLTANQLAGKITQLLGRDYLVKPQVIVEVRKYLSQKVYVLGQVDRPGLYYLKGVTTLLEMISQAGGITGNAGNRLLIIRAGANDIKSGKKLDELLKKYEADKIDLRALLVEGDLSYNRILQPEDVLFIPSREAATEDNIYVMGALKRPGAYEYKEGLTALNACIIAGGFTIVAAPNRAVISRLLGNRKRSSIKLNLEKVKDGELMDLQLEPGDRIFIPESYF